MSALYCVQIFLIPIRITLTCLFKFLTNTFLNIGVQKKKKKLQTAYIMRTVEHNVQLMKGINNTYEFMDHGTAVI